MYKKAIYLFLVLALLLAACAPKATPTAAPEPTQPAAEEEKPEPTKAPELEPVTITWYLAGSVPVDLKEVNEYLSNLPQLKAINTKVELIFFDWGEYDQKMQLMFAGGEECDLVFTASWMNNYTNNAINGNLIPLDDLLPKVTPKLWEAIPENAWTMSKVRGKIYGIPNQQIWYEAWGIILDKEIADKYSIDLAKINTFEDLNPYLAKVYEGEPQLKKKIIGELNGTHVHPLTWNYEQVTLPGVIKLGDTTRKIVNWYETPEFRKAIELSYQWHEAGYSPDEPLDGAEMNKGRMIGEYPFKFHVAKPGVDSEEKAMTGREQVAKSLQPPVLSYVTPTMTGICTTSKNPERALMVFELSFLDEVVYNTIAKGIEGKHWVWVDKEKKVIGYPEGITAENTTWLGNSRDWMFGNQFIAYYVDANQVGAWEETERINNEASLPMDGPFVFDPSPVQAEVAAVDAVVQQFTPPLYWGLVSPDDPEKGIDAFNKALKDAGVEKILAEMQKQLDAFIAENPDIYK